MFLDFLRVYNGPITWDMLYHPKLLTVYHYFHHMTFILTTFLSLLTCYIILKKSSKAMGFYKYVLLNSLFWNYLLDTIYFLYRPVNLFPYIMIYSAGVLNFLSPDTFMGVFYCSGFVLLGVVHSISMALFYRVAQVFPNTSFNAILNTRRKFWILYAMLLMYCEGFWTISFTTFIIKPYNSTASLISVIQQEPIYATFVSLEPSTTGCDFETQCHQFFLMLNICMGILALTLWIGFLILYAIYFLKARKLGKSLSSNTARMNTMLFRALNMQISIVAVSWTVPGVIIGVVVVLRIEYANLISQICLFFPLLYPIFEIMAILYFVKPYRDFIIRCLNRILLSIGVKRVTPHAAIGFIANTPGL